jgi:SAM-dependent methyltransferase
VAKRTGKTHENLENELTPPPTTAPPRTRSSVKNVRGDRSGPIGISGGDFATPSSRKRTTTQPRGVPVLSPAATTTATTTPPTIGQTIGQTIGNGTPAPLVAGSQPEAPFASPTSADLGDPTTQLAAEAAAARALDSGPITPPPTVDDPGPTPPPIAAEPSPASTDEPTFEEAPTPPPVVVAVSDADLGANAPSAVTEEPTSSASLAGAEVPLPAEALVDVAPATAVDGVDAHFSAHETPWPELGQQAAVVRVASPPGAIPTDAMGGEGSGGARELSPETPPVDGIDGADARKSPDDGDVSVVDALEVDDGAESLDALPPEALADATTEPLVAPTPPAPPPRAAAAPPPIPAGPARRKTGELRAPEVPTAQVLASIVPSSVSGAAALPEALAQRPRRSKRSKPWFEEVFDEDYLRTLPFMSADQTLREVEFIESSLGVKPGGQILDVGCGYGRHAIELVQRGLDVTGLDLSLPLLLRAADEAQKRAMSVNFVHADMREMAFEKQFDGVCCMLTSFGYFDEETNLRVAEGIARALKPGGRLLLDLVNRDYVVGDLPSRVWWEGNGCVVLEEVDFNFHTSRIITHRSIVFEDGRQVEQEISVRAYSLHEIGRLLRQAGFRVIDISGGLATRGHFFGGTSRNLLILAEKRTDET